jgi:hypothetical protein
MAYAFGTLFTYEYIDGDESWDHFSTVFRECILTRDINETLVKGLRLSRMTLYLQSGKFEGFVKEDDESGAVFYL